MGDESFNDIEEVIDDLYEHKISSEKVQSKILQTLIEFYNLNTQAVIRIKELEDDVMLLKDKYREMKSKNL